MRAGAGLAAALLVAGCAATAPPPRVTAGPPPRVALMPLENLAGRPEPEDLLTRVFLVALGEDGAYEVVEPGDLEAVLSDLRIRTTSMLTREQATAIAARVRADYLMLGTILEYGAARTPEGEVPSVGVSLRALSGRTGRVVWTGMKVRTGEDRETVFGWGRERSRERLAESTARELVRGFRLPAGVDSLPAGGGRP